MSLSHRTVSQRLRVNESLRTRSPKRWSLRTKMMRRKVKRDKQVKEGGNLVWPAAWVGLSVQRAPTSFYSIHPLEPRAPGPWAKVRVHTHILYSAGEVIPFGMIPQGKAIQYVQVTSEGDIQSKEAECGGWTPRDEPLRFNTPPQPSPSPHEKRRRDKPQCQ